MAEHDDAVSPMGDDEERSRPSQSRTGGHPLARVWAWFNAQPTQTKVIIVGVIVVLGVIAWMALRNKNSSADTSSEEVKPGRFTPLGVNPLSPSSSTPTTSALTDAANTATAPAVSAPISPNQTTQARPQITAQAAPVAAVKTPTYSQPALIVPVRTYKITPVGMTPTMRGPDVGVGVPGVDASRPPTMRGRDVGI